MRRPVMAVPGIEARPVVRRGDLHPVAVELHLEQPALAGGWRVNERRQLRLDEAGQLARPAAFGLGLSCRGLGFYFGFRAARPGLALGGTGRLGGGDRLEITAAGDALVMFEQDVALTIDQIGRASCRERVCQYV